MASYTSSPVCWGMIRSQRITSKDSRASRATASRPSATAITSCSASTRHSSRRTLCSSSTTRIRARGTDTEGDDDELAIPTTGTDLGDLDLSAFTTRLSFVSRF